MISLLLQQGFQAFQRGAFDQARALCEAVLKLDAANADACHLAGMSWLEQGRTDEACGLLERAAGHRPDDALILSNLGVARRAAGDTSRALEAYAAALRLRPQEAVLHFNCANALAELERFEEAIAAFRRAQVLDPQDPAARWNEALAQLALGNFAEGWEGYEAGWANGSRDQRFGSAAPLWDGQTALAGRTILVWAEQGYGDALQFVRYVPLLAAQGARVIVQCQATLCELLQRVEGCSAVFARGEPLPPHDLQCPMMSLPRACRTRLETIPAGVPYLRAEAGRMAAQEARLPAAKWRVGVVWSGSTAHQNDARRSIPLARFLPLLEQAPASVAFVCLQKDLRRSDEQALARLGEDFFRGGQWGDFADTAALVASLDLVICVDTAVAHLAAALGRPTWLLLPRPSDWRWLLEREDSPWYPGMRLFRQQAAGDWDEVLARVAQALGMLAAGPAPQRRPNLCVETLPDGE